MRDSPSVPLYRKALALLRGNNEIKPEEIPEAKEQNKRANRLSGKKGRKQLHLFNSAKQWPKGYTIASNYEAEAKTKEGKKLFMKDDRASAEING